MSDALMLVATSGVEPAADDPVLVATLADFESLRRLMAPEIEKHLTDAQFLGVLFNDPATAAIVLAGLLAVHVSTQTHIVAPSRCSVVNFEPSP